MENSGTLYLIGFALLFAGILVLVAAAIFAATRSRKAKTRTAGVIIIGPFPIIFGSDKKTVKTLLILSTALMVLLVVAMLVYYFLIR
jgi:uncharacterized protein (TIGR00304 family)